MTKIIHLSDLHFGTERKILVNLLFDEINRIEPDIIIISGDLTQRATREQYSAAKEFLNALKFPLICVPGNHDISFYNLIERFCYPFQKYQHWISSTLCQSLVQQPFAILGINSVTPYKPMGGYITEKQLMMVKNFFSAQSADTIKIVVMHHNLVRSERHKIINDAQKIINTFADCGVNLVLSGHLHLAKIESLKTPHATHPMYVITAATPISYRTEEANSFNLLEFNDNHFKFIVQSLRDNKFIATKEDVYFLHY